MSISLMVQKKIVHWPSSPHGMISINAGLTFAGALIKIVTPIDYLSSVLNNYSDVRLSYQTYREEGFAIL